MKSSIACSEECPNGSTVNSGSVWLFAARFLGRVRLLNMASENDNHLLTIIRIWTKRRVAQRTFVVARESSLAVCGSDEMCVFSHAQVYADCNPSQHPLSRLSGWHQRHKSPVAKADSSRCRERLFWSMKGLIAPLR